MRTRSALFMEALDVDEVIAQLLVTEGFATVEEIGETHVDEMMQIQGFDEEVAAELINRANTWLDEQARKLKEQSDKLGIADDLMTMDGLTSARLSSLAKTVLKRKTTLRIWQRTVRLKFWVKINHPQNSRNVDYEGP